MGINGNSPPERGEESSEDENKGGEKMKTKLLVVGMVLSLMAGVAMAEVSLGQGKWPCGHEWYVVYVEGSHYRIDTPEHGQSFSVMVTKIDDRVKLEVRDGMGTVFVGADKTWAWVRDSGVKILEEGTIGHSICVIIYEHFTRGSI